MIAPAIPLPVLLLIWHGHILWGSGWMPSQKECEEVKEMILENPMITNAECMK